MALHPIYLHLRESVLDLPGVIDAFPVYEFIFRKNTVAYDQREIPTLPLGTRPSRLSKSRYIYMVETKHHRIFSCRHCLPGDGLGSLVSTLRSHITRKVYAVKLVTVAGVITSTGPREVWYLEPLLAELHRCVYTLYMFGNTSNLSRPCRKVIQHQLGFRRSNEQITQPGRALR